MAIKTYEGLEFDTISRAIEAYVDGSDHGCGELETLQSTSNNITICLGNLIELLADKGIITENEIQNKVLNGLFA